MLLGMLQDFEFDVEAASLLRLTCYNSRGRLLGDDFSGKVVIDVRASHFGLGSYQ